MLYVAMTRGRGSNTAYLYERMAGDSEHTQPDGVHLLRRGTTRQAAQLARALIANHDEQARTAHDIAAETHDHDQLPDRVRRLLDRRAGAVQRRRAAYRHWQEETQELLAERHRWNDQHIHRSQDQGLDYGIDL